MILLSNRVENAEAITAAARARGLQAEGFYAPNLTPEALPTRGAAHVVIGGNLQECAAALDAYVRSAAGLPAKITLWLDPKVEGLPQALNAPFSPTPLLLFDHNLAPRERVVLSVAWGVLAAETPGAAAPKGLLGKVSGALKTASKLREELSEDGPSVEAQWSEGGERRAYDASFGLVAVRSVLGELTRGLVPSRAGALVVCLGRGAQREHWVQLADDFPSLTLRGIRGLALDGEPHRMSALDRVTLRPGPVVSLAIVQG